MGEIKPIYGNLTILKWQPWLVVGSMLSRLGVYGCVGCVGWAYMDVLVV